jgi:pimeloyl-ACP methyl ester carboxylesterase
VKEAVVVLSDGRRVGYAEYGAPDGIPLLEFHGFPGSRHYHLDEQALEAAGVRLLSVERPGVGLSDRLPDRRLLDWPPLVEAFADELRLGRFGVFGVSAGGPSAMACGYAMPERVAVVGLVCAVGPAFDHPRFDALLGEEMAALLPIARQDFETARALVRDFLKPTAQAVADDVDAFFDGAYLAGVHEIDRPRFAAQRDLWIACLQATYGHGVDGVVDEVGATFGPWGFAPSSVRVPVRAWHGVLDRTPIDAIRFVVDSVADGHLTEYPDEAHYLSEEHHPDWIAALTEWAR